MDVKGQGALEYLLLIGGAVLVAAIVIALISGMPTAVDAEARAYCGSFFNIANCSASNVQDDVDVSTGTCCPIQEDGSEADSQENFYQCWYDNDADNLAACTYA